MQVAVGVPQREDGVACVVALCCESALHLRVFPVDVAHYAGVDKRVVERCVKDGLLLVGAAAHLDAGDYQKAMEYAKIGGRSKE